VAPVALAAVAIALLRRARWVAAAVTVFALGFAPVSGLVPFDFQAFSTVSDHYLYLSMLGAALAAAFGLERLLRRGTPRARRGGVAGIAVVLAVLGVRSLLQTLHWRDSVTLFEHATRVNPNSHVAYTQLAMALEDRHRFGEAMAAYEAAARVRPDLPGTRANFAGILARTGELDRAEALYRQVLAARPGFEQAELGLKELERVRSQRTPPTRPGAER
jgi:tetratricopeptide (TPR) repeat protein